MKYQYKAIDSEGNFLQGEVEATSELDALQSLHEKGFHPVEIKPASRWRFIWKKKQNLSDLLLFTKQLAQLLSAGLAIDRALKVLQKIFSHAGKTELVAIIESISRDLAAGNSFADALAHHPFFPSYYVSLVKAGLAAGALPQVLQELATYLEEQQHFRQELLSALLYPAFLLAFGLFAIQTILIYVLPRFGRIFKDLGVDPPFITRILLKIGLFWRDWGPAFLLIMLIGGIILRFRLSDPEGRIKLENFLLRLPTVGRYLLLVDLARLSRALAVLLRGGVPIENALEMSQEVVNLDLLKKILKQANEGLQRGEKLSSSFRQLPEKVAFVYDLIAVGEETGDLAQAFAEIAILAEEDVRIATKRFLTLIEPLAILFFGLVLGGMIISILLAIFSLRV